MRKVEVEVAEQLSLPIMVALTRRPMNAAEVGRTLLITAASAGERLRALERAGWVVRRASDKRWVMRVVLEPKPLPDLTQLKEARQEAEIAPEPPVLVRVAPTPAPPPKNAPERLVDAGDAKSSKTAKTLNLPSYLDGAGELSVGAGARCSVCGKGTPVKYGVTAICPVCARSWRKVDAAGSSHSE